ncbi:MAG: ABC transporter ATP-binding protein [Pirellulaceae bacterium]|nr:ABC transporter ATP-binding protein [Pirellulaceae bacterium]
MTTVSSTMIELLRLHRFFGDTRAVDDISFDVAAGEVFGYIGPNGAGKTTSMRILATLELPTMGDARVDGFSSIDDPDRVRSRLGFMPDSFGAYANMSCEEYLDFFARAYGLAGRERTAACAKVMDFTGLDGLREKPTRGLSKGMKQRLCLGRALIHDPPVLILDEPAAGLDPRARIELREMIGELAANGKTLLISSHILSELAEMCDKVAIIEHGRLLAVGTVAEIEGELADRAGNAGRRTLRIRLCDRVGEAETWLQAQPEIEVARQGEELFVTHTADRNFEAQLLREMIEAGCTVSEFAPHGTSLEDIFLEVTRGAVQ